MGVINRTARGLLSLLDSQTQGVVPSSLGEVIAPVLEMGPFIYGSRGMEIVENASNAAGPGIYGGITVPAGQCWHIWGIQTFVNQLDAGSTNIRVSPAFRQTPAFSVWFHPESANPPSVGFIAGVGNTFNLTWTARWMPLILNQGAEIASEVMNGIFGAPGYSVQTQVAFFRLTV